jgi:hypothetical protein
VQSKARGAAKRRAQVKHRSESIAEVIERSGGQCEWPRCVARGEVKSHLHTRGMGGVPSHDGVEQISDLCRPHDQVMESGCSPTNSGCLAALQVLADCDCHEFTSDDLRRRWGRAEAMKAHVTDCPRRVSDRRTDQHGFPIAAPEER